MFFCSTFRFNVWLINIHICVRVENMAKQLKTVSYSRRLNVVVFGACTQRTVTSSRSVDSLVYAFLFVLRPAHIPDVHYIIIHANISQIARVRGSASGVCVSLDTIFASYWKRTHPKCLLLGHSTLATFTFRHEYTNKLFRRIHRYINLHQNRRQMLHVAGFNANEFHKFSFWRVVFLDT